MATFPTPDRAIKAALRMRDAIQDLDKDLLLKIGHTDAAKLLETNEIRPVPREHVLRGIADRLLVFEIP
jgi:hypothetical protein